MSSTDNRVVQMQFDNKTFMKNAADTSKSLADVDKAVSNAGKSTGLLDLSSQMTTVAATASKMAVVTTTALATIANKVTNVGINLVKSLTFDPIKQGFSEYEALLTKQNTIMNATGLSAKTVKKYLNELNHYSDKTIYSFGNMSESIMKFVNAGVPLKEAIGTVKGIANAAAYAGASTEDANRAMFAFGQSISNGFLTLGDFNQIETANMATVQFKNTLLEAAAAQGTLTKKGDMYVTASGKSINATKGFQYSLQEQWATTKVLNDALGMYNDNSTKLGKKAAQSATEVRTFTAFIDTLKESIGSGWSSIFTALFGNLTQATNFWTGFSNAIGGSVKQFFNFISTALMVWRKMGGFEKVLQGFKNILAPFGALLGAIGDAWSQAFPSGRKGAGKALYELSSGFELITRPLAWLAKAIPAITPVLVVFFTIIHKGISAIGDVLHFVWDFVAGVKELSDVKAPKTGGFLGFVQNVTRYVKGAIKQVDKLVDKAGGLGGMFSGFSLPSLPSMPDISGGANEASGAATKTASGMATAMKVLQSIAVKMGAAFHWLWDQAIGFFEKADPSDFIAAFNSAIFATMGIQVIRLVHNLGDAFNSFTEIGEGAASVLNGTGSALKSFQTAAQAKLIIAIALAMVALAASLWLLSKIPIERLAPALAAMGALMVMMNVSMKSFGTILKKTDGLVKSVNMVALAASILLLALAMIAFAGAMLIMNKVEWGSIAKGLITMGVALKLVGSLGDMAAGSYKNMLAGAFAIGAVSASMVILAGALMLFQLVKWKSMGKAGAAIGVITAAIAGIAMIPYEGVAKVGVAMLATSVGMVALANALLIFQLVKWESIGKASVMLGVLALAVAAMLLASGEGAGAAILLATAAAMVALALACIMFNHVDWNSIAKATTVLTILTVAVAALGLILAAFLYIIAPVAPVLIILAAGFALLGLGLLAFAGAMAIAMTLAAAGTAAFAALATGAAVAVGVFLQTLAAEAPLMRKSILAILDEMIQTVVDAAPMIIQGFKDLWANIMKEMGSEDKKKSFGQLAEEWLDRLIKFANKNIPKVNKLFVDMVVDLLHNLSKHADDFAAIGVEFVVKLIEGIAKRQGAIVTAAINLVIAMANGVRKNVKKLTDAGIDLIATFLHELADSIRSGSSKIGSGIADVVSAMSTVGINMIQGMISGISSVDIESVIVELAQQLPAWARKLLGIKSPSRVFMEIGKFVALGLTNGIQRHAAAAITAVGSMVGGQIAIAEQYINGYIQRLDQKAIEAEGRAAGLAAAAKRAEAAANKTKTKTDDHAAHHLTHEAKQADKAAKAATKKAEAEKNKQQKAAEFKDADSFGKAQIKSQNAENQLAAAKAAEQAAVKDRAQANALDKASHAAGVTDKQRKQMQNEADRLRKQAKADAERANALVKQARDSAADALVWQKKAGQEAADAFQQQFADAAKADKDADAFEKLTDTEKATRRRNQAALLQAAAEADLKKAKKLALTDLKAANELAQRAMDEADQARQYLDDAQGYDDSAAQAAKDAADKAADDAKTATNAPLTGHLNMTQAEAAAWYAQQHMQTYADAYASASAGVQFNQYNSSPESLSPSEIYRQTNNQLAYASDKLAP